MREEYKKVQDISQTNNNYVFDNKTSYDYANPLGKAIG
jgi:hypothetical protein